MKCTMRFQEELHSKASRWLVHDSWSISLIYNKALISSFATGPNVAAGHSANTELNPCKTVTAADSLS